MKRWQTYSIVGILAWAAAGCGFGRPQAITHNTKPNTVEKEILTRMADWQSVRTDVSESLAVSGSRPQTLDYQVTSDLADGQYVVSLSSPSPMSFYVNDHETIWYPQSTKHYSLLPGLPAADQPLSAAARIPALIRASALKSVVVKGSLVTLQMSAPFPSATEQAAMSVTYDTKTNVLTEWQAQWGSTHVTEDFSHFQVNPSLPAGVYTFVPPAGVTPEVALSETGTALNIAEGEVDFPIALPPAGANMTLNAINTGTNAQGKSVVIMSFAAPDSNAVVITEKASVHALSSLPDKSLSATTETVGALTVFVGSLPDSMEEAAFLERKTEVIIEGATSTVDTLLNAWAAEPSLVPSS